MSFDSCSPLAALCLFCSLPLHPKYNDFRHRLEQYLPLLYASTLPTTGDRAIDTVLEVLQAEREKDKVVEAENNEDRNEMSDGFRASTTDQDEVGLPLAPVDKVHHALKIFVHNTTEDFSFAPRDVYDGAPNLHQTKKQHVVTVENFDYTEL